MLVPSIVHTLQEVNTQGKTSCGLEVCYSKTGGLHLNYPCTEVCILSIWSTLAWYSEA